MTAKLPITRSVVVASKPNAIQKPCTQFLSELEDGGFSDEDIFATHLALEEAFSNAVNHGNKADRDKEIEIKYLVSSDKVEITIADEGEGFDPESVPDPRCGENLYRPEGRGLFLIRSYMDVVEFNAKGNCLHMVRYKGKKKRRLIGRQG
jgi:serine/threonine-protein kinase RsbW